MILAFSAIILAMSNTISMLIATLSLSACKTVKACGFECEMTERHKQDIEEIDDTEGEEEKDDTVGEMSPPRPTLSTYDKSPLWQVPKVD